MDYAEAREAFFQPRGADAAPAGTSGWQSPARRLRDTIEPIATICYLRARGLIDDGGLTGAGSALRADLEENTDRQLAPVLDVLGPAVRQIMPLLDGWSRQIIERGWFPPDPYKRASG